MHHDGAAPYASQSSTSLLAVYFAVANYDARRLPIVAADDVDVVVDAAEEPELPSHLERRGARRRRDPEERSEFRAGRPLFFRRRGRRPPLRHALATPPRRRKFTRRRLDAAPRRYDDHARATFEMESKRDRAHTMTFSGALWRLGAFSIFLSVARAGVFFLLTGMVFDGFPRAGHRARGRVDPTREARRVRLVQLGRRPRAMIECCVRDRVRS